jgi:hypothetical protein|tara:strand:+ start:1581 stop:1949 length:369 start_codon:yes stop_codon:yes gene_type:complete
MARTPFKMKGFPAHAGVSPLKRETPQMRKDKKDVLRKNIVDTSQKGDEEIRAKQDSKKKSKKIGPVESPEAIDKKYDEHFAAKDKIKASAKKGDSFRTYMGEGPASEKTKAKVEEARAYEKR